VRSPERRSPDDLEIKNERIFALGKKIAENGRPVRWI
jgi:hypothetical protein